MQMLAPLFFLNLVMQTLAQTKTKTKKKGSRCSRGKSYCYCYCYYVAEYQLCTGCIVDKNDGYQNTIFVNARV